MSILDRERNAEFGVFGGYLEAANSSGAYHHEIILKGRLAQLAEHCDHTAGVTGSSPVAPTTNQSDTIQYMYRYLAKPWKSSKIFIR